MGRWLSDSAARRRRHVFAAETVSSAAGRGPKHPPESAAFSQTVPRSEGAEKREPAAEHSAVLPHPRFPEFGVHFGSRRQRRGRRQSVPGLEQIAESRRTATAEFWPCSRREAAARV